jgi:hypothetical protein
VVRLLAPIRVLRWTPAAVRRREGSASRYPAGPCAPCGARVRERGGCSSPTSATDSTSRAPALIARFPVRLPLSRFGRVQWGEPHETCRAVSRLTALHALRSNSAHAPADPAVAGVPDTLVSSDICEPSKGRPPFRGVVFRGRRVRTDRLTPPVATCSAPFDAPPAAETAFPPTSSKAGVVNDPGRLPSTSARSAPRPLRDVGPRTRARHRSQGLAARDPASDALSPPRSVEGVARPRPLPCALHARALPGHAPLVDFCNRNDPQARPADLETRCAWRPLGFHRAPLPRHRSAFRWGRAGFPTRFHRSGAE